MSDVLTTKVSTKGQVILPKAVRDERRWPPGTELEVELTDEGVLLKAARATGRTKPEDVFGVLNDGRPAKTLKEMDEAIARGVMERHARGGY